MAGRRRLALALFSVAAFVVCGGPAGADESVVARTARDDFFEIRSLLTGADAQSWWDDLRGTRLSMGLWVVTADADSAPPVLRLGPERDGPVEVTLQLDHAFVWSDVVGEEVVVSGVPRTLRVNPFHLMLDEGVVRPVRPSSTDRGPAPSLSFTIEPPEVAAGEAVTLRWESQHAGGAKLNQGIGRVETTGSRVVRPSQTTTYTATVRGAGGEASASATVTVR